MKWQPQKPNTKPIFIVPKDINNKPTFNKVVLKFPNKNTKKVPRNLRHKYQIPIWYWYFLGIPNSWFPIDITNTNPITYQARQHVHRAALCCTVHARSTRNLMHSSWGMRRYCDGTANFARILSVRIVTADSEKSPPEWMMDSWTQDGWTVGSGQWTVDGGQWTVNGGRMGSWTVDGGRLDWWTVDGGQWTVDGWTVDGGRLDSWTAGTVDGWTVDSGRWTVDSEQWTAG